MLAWDYSYKRLEIPNDPSWLFNASAGMLVIGNFNAFKSADYRGFNDPPIPTTRGIVIARVTSLGRREPNTKQPWYLNLSLLQVYPKCLWGGYSRYQAPDTDGVVKWKLFNPQNTKTLTLEELSLIAEVIGVHKLKITPTGKFKKENKKLDKTSVL